MFKKKLSLYFYKNKLASAFSLLEMMIIIGISAILMLSIMTMFSNLEKENQKFTQKIALHDVNFILKRVLSNGAFCKANFFPGAPLIDLTSVPASGAPSAIPLISPVEIREGVVPASPLVLSTAGGIPGVRKLLVTSIELTNWIQTDPVALPAANDRYNVDLVIKLKSEYGEIAPLIIKSIQVKTDLAPIASRTVLDCSSTLFSGLAVYKCPLKLSCDDGQIVNGAWASYGCFGQLTTINYCLILWWNGGSRSCTNSCPSL